MIWTLLAMGVGILLGPWAVIWPTHRWPVPVLVALGAAGWSLFLFCVGYIAFAVWSIAALIW